MFLPVFSHLNIFNCFQAFEKEIALSFFNYSEFKVKAYSEDRKTLGLCWIVPGKLLALDDQVTTEEHLYTHNKSIICFIPVIFL